MSSTLHVPMPSSPRRCLIVGCGYVGTRLAKRTAGRWDNTAIVRSETSAAALSSAQCRGTVIDLDRLAPSRRLHSIADAAAVLYLVPPPDEGRHDPRLERFLGAIGSARPEMMLYMSTTGVYGDCGGALVDETAAIAPTRDPSLRRAAAETAARNFCAERGVRSIIFRTPGIYGPGRLPISRLLRGEPVLRTDISPPGNRIHVDDLVSACIRAVEGSASGVFNISDGDHASTSKFLLATATLAGLPEPRQVSMAEARQQISPGMLAFLTESRRIDNRRMREELGFVPRYADYRQGIKSSLVESRLD